MIQDKVRSGWLPSVRNAAVRPIPRALQTGYRRIFRARLLGFGRALGALGATFLSVSDPPHCAVRSSSVQPPTCFAEINDDLNVKLSRYSSILSTSPKNFIPLSISSCLNLLYFLVIFNNTLFFFFSCLWSGPSFQWCTFSVLVQFLWHWWSWDCDHNSFYFSVKFYYFYNCKLQTSPLTRVLARSSPLCRPVWCSTGASRLFQSDAFISSLPSPRLSVCIPTRCRSINIGVSLNPVLFLTILVLWMRKFCGFWSPSGFDWSRPPHLCCWLPTRALVFLLTLCSGPFHLTVALTIWPLCLVFSFEI